MGAILNVLKKAAGVFLVIFLFAAANPSGLSARSLPASPNNKGLVLGLSFVGGPCLPGDPDRMSGRSGTYWSAMGSWLSFGGQVLMDGFYYFNPLFALNFGLGFGSYHSKWSGSGEGFGDPEVMNYRGYNLMIRFGVSNLYGNFFISAGAMAAPTLFSTSDYTGTVTGGEHKFGPSGFPLGVYANLGFRIGSVNSTQVPIGFEFMLLNNYCFDYNGYRIIMWSWNGYIGVLF